MLCAISTHLAGLSLDSGQCDSWSKCKIGCQKVNCRNAEISGVTPFWYCNVVIPFGRLGSEHMLCTSAMYCAAMNHAASGAPVLSTRRWIWALRYLIAFDS